MEPGKYRYQRHKNSLKIFIPFSLSIVTYFVLANVVNPYMPGIWIDIPVVFTSLIILIAIFLVLAVCQSIIQMRRWLRVALSALFFAIIGLNLVGAKQDSRNLATARFNAEKSEYSEAVVEGKNFHNQVSETHGNRNLVYWRWAQTGFDNAVGIIFDPSDKLLQDEKDKVAFQKKTGGIIVRIHRIEAKWYAVWHT